MDGWMAGYVGAGETNGQQGEVGTSAGKFAVVLLWLGEQELRTGNEKETEPSACTTPKLPETTLQKRGVGRKKGRKKKERQPVAGATSFSLASGRPAVPRRKKGKKGQRKILGLEAPES